MMQVICGISLGSNCGFHTFSSAVVAGARQALMCGIPSMALSLEWKDTESYEDDLVAAAHFCLPLIRTALTDSQTNRVLDGLFLNINMPTPFSHNKGFRITQQGSSRPKIKWQVLPSQKSPFGVGLCKQTAIGVRVAQLGLAASAAGAARRANSSSKCIEVESIAGPPNGSEGAIHKKKHHFRMEVTEMVGDGDKTSEFEALRDGFVSVTPLGPRNESDPDVLRRLTEWMGSFVQLDTSLPL
ncbi:hypothetical protein KP509_13G073000 [Ceratopteris richardii]|uniref:Survival protein SurE-like phosphatase/nucleotidase domain-containing protein n=1 Tax=Ceratopteris richardii TaxID=49495 RepID=A0A8T2TK16_CERRI|nr:hypothetical protein KP509_13G073000 [Ceratopteris richardii]